MAITYQFNDPEFGKINVIPSTTKLLGGKTTLTVTIQILPIKNFGVGKIYFTAGFSDGPGTAFNIAEFGYNPHALVKNVATSYTDTCEIPIYRNGSGDPSTIIDNIELTIWNINTGSRLSGANSWTYKNNKIQYKYGYEPIDILDESTFYQLGDSANIYQGEGYSYVYPLSKPFVTLNREGIFYDTFTTNALQVYLEIEEDEVSTQLFWGNTSFNYAYSNNLNYRLHVYDAYSSEVYIPAEENGEPQYYSVPMLFYTAPRFTNDFSIVRHSVDTAAQEPEDKIDEEGEYAKLIGGVKITEFGGALARTATLTVNLVGTNGVFIDMSTGGQATLPFEVYTTIIDVNHLGQKVDGYYIFNNGHFYPTYTAWQDYSPGGNGPYSATTTYDFQLVLNDGFTTTTIDYQISSAEGILFIEPWGGIGINGKPFQEDAGDPIFDLHCPMNIDSIHNFYGTSYDTGWLFATLNTSNFINNSWLKVRRIGNMVNIVGRFQPANNIANQGNIAICSLAAQFRPTNNATSDHPQDYYIQVAAGATLPGWLVRINYNGQVTLYNYTGTADSRMVSLNMMYFVDLV